MIKTFDSYNSYNSFLINYLLPIFIKVVLITIFKHLIKKSLIPIIKHNDLSKIKIGRKKLFTLIINFILISYLLYILIKTLEV